MSNIKKGDFIEIEYIGRIKETNKIFDLTDKNLAKKENIYNPKASYKPLIICIGNHDIVSGLEDFLIGKKPSKYKIELKPEQAFGKKDPKLIKIISINKFNQQKIKPFPGLQVNIDGLTGLIRVVSGGRVIVDFNYPLAGKNIIYEIKVNRIIKRDEEKLKGFAKLHLSAEASLENNIAKIKKKLPKELEEEFSKKIKRLIPLIKKVKFVLDSKSKENIPKKVTEKLKSKK